MVLDEASASSKSFEDEQPLSDYDAYSSPDPLPSFSKYPTKINLPPFGLQERLLFWSKERYEGRITSIIRDRMDLASVCINRFPTQEESDAFVSQASAFQKIPRVCRALGLGIGLAPVLLQLSTGRFSRSKNRTSLLPINSMVLRAAFILTFTYFVGGVVGDFAGVTYIELRTTLDPRLAGFRQDLAKQDIAEVEQRLRQFKRERAARKVGLRPTSPPPSTIPPPLQEPILDDASPAGGFVSGHGGSPDPYANYGASTDGGESQASQSSSKILGDTVFAQQREAPHSASDAYQTETHTEAGSSYRSSDDNAGDFFDDASHTARDTRTDTRKNNNIPSSGSAWDRIRQAASPSSNPPEVGSRPPSSFRTPHQSQQGQKNGSSGFSSGSRTRTSVSEEPDSNPSFSSSDSDGLMAREQAQRDFDRLVERERQVCADGSGEDGGTWRKRW